MTPILRVRVMSEYSEGGFKVYRTRHACRDNLDVADDVLNGVVCVENVNVWEDAR